MLLSLMMPLRTILTEFILIEFGASQIRTTTLLIMLIIYFNDLSGQQNHDYVFISANELAQKHLLKLKASFSIYLHNL